MVIKSVNLETVCGVTSKLPKHSWPEFAFAGKSNVGKSTLINGIMNRKNYAHTSSSPGKTQTINYYNINDTFYLVDLPGYGYAAAGQAVKAGWGEMIENYLRSSGSLKAVFLLVDARHEPSANDIMMYDWILQAGFHPYVIATKADKLKRSQLAAQKKMIASALAKGSLVGQEVTVPVTFWSGMNKTGLEEIHTLLDRLLQE